MQINDEAAYRVISARDARFDGRLFVGVTSTRVYCRPVCRVRTPLKRNCRFFANAASAEAHGFRPCLRCRPELAPGLSLVDSSHVLADQAARWLEQKAHDGEDIVLPALAAKLGVTDRHLRRIFALRHGVSPIDYLSTQRLLLAKQLLTDSALPVTQVALASGFASLRRFNAAFVERYRMNPTALRREGRGQGGAAVAARRLPVAAPGATAATTPDAIVLRLGYRPPYDRDALLGFLARRCVDGIEAVDLNAAGGAWLRRTLALAHQSKPVAGWLAIRFAAQRHEVELALAPQFAALIGALVQRTRHALDLDADPGPIDTALGAMRLPPRPGLRLPGSFDGFEAAVRIILGQQVTLAAARTLTARLVQRFGEPVVTPFTDLNRLFPTPFALATADAAAIGTLGIVRQRVGALQALARAVCDRRIELHRAAPLTETMAALVALPGIGPWTAQLIAMRALGWPDAFPASDIGVLNALGTRSAAAALSAAESWRPWRAYAVIRLWMTLENP
jgi:AraC family transcriptional regulator of adaptative response / DNA-3-methyladenine glycosylase II